jgi:hypothetical protein
LQVNLFNAVYLIFFLVFIVSPGRAARYWGGLVIYCEFVILCIYMYYFSVLKGTRPRTGVSIEVGASKISFIFFSSWTFCVWKMSQEMWEEAFFIASKTSPVPYIFFTEDRERNFGCTNFNFNDCNDPDHIPVEVAQVIGLAPQKGSPSLIHVLGWHLAILALAVIQWVFFRVVHVHKSNQERCVPHIGERGIGGHYTILHHMAVSHHSHAISPVLPVCAVPLAQGHCCVIYLTPSPTCVHIVGA